MRTYKTDRYICDGFLECPRQLECPDHAGRSRVRVL